VLVCDVLLRGGRGVLPDCVLPHELLGRNLGGALLGGHLGILVPCGDFPTLLGAAPFHRVLRHGSWVTVVTET